jgi:hypothetical protein
METHLEDRHLIHMLDFTNGQHLIQEYSCHVVPINYNSYETYKLPYQRFQYLTYVKDTDPNGHIKVFKKIIRANILNLFGFTLRDNISEWGQNFVQDHLITFWRSWSKHFPNFFEA